MSPGGCLKLQAVRDDNRIGRQVGTWSMVQTMAWCLQTSWLWLRQRKVPGREGETKLHPILSGTNLYKTSLRFGVYDLGIFLKFQTLKIEP
jgi:hypothetical protein